MSTAPARLRGYSTAGSARELHWEREFLAQPEPRRVRADIRHLSAYPHNAGSPRQHQLALWILKQLQADGFQAHIEHFQTLYPVPVRRLVELVAPVHFKAALKEPPINDWRGPARGEAARPRRVHPSAGQAGQLPTMAMYAADGNVTAPLVYVNFGLPRDYARLRALGISVKGDIVIARYGMGWRGLKPWLAYQHGAVGCLIYSDPHEDGYFRGKVYPQGPYRPAEGVQRGSVMQMELHPGDPETPGWGSVPGARRLPLDQADTLQKIPVMPLAYADALPLLKALGGPVAPESWRGALPITYHVGAGPARVHLVLKSHWGLADLYDVIGMIPGRSRPNRWVLRGNHFDAWVNGADDPDSGQASLLEEARGLGVLLRQGWRPRRTIVYAAWDGEEPALIGSTEWAETHAAELRQKAVAYLNSDNNARGFLRMGGSQTLQRLLNDVARGIADPETHASVWEREWRHRLQTANPRRRSLIMDGSDLRLPALGSGSDYTPFLQHLGIASADLSFGGEGGNGVYHSAYDDFYWYTHFGDPHFVYGRALAQLMGTAVMRLADAEVLPLQFSGFAYNVAEYVDEVQDELAAQPGAPNFNFQPLQTAVKRLRIAAAAYDRAFSADSADGEFGRLNASRRRALNDLLSHSEQQLLEPAGLPGRPWYKHQIYAPGFYTGYSVKTLPGVREAIEQKQYALAAREAQALVKTLDGFTAQIQAAGSKL